MGQRPKPGATHERTADQEMRDQEVLRANRELAAYFKGRRTEREARAALKIIKAFVRDREHQDPKSRRPLPGAGVTKMPKVGADRKAASGRGESPRRKPRRARRGTSAQRGTGVTGTTGMIEAHVNPELPEPH
jgi:hypothetical protein